MRPLTTIKSNETMYPMNSLPEEVKKARRSKSVVQVACLTKGEASWVIACEDDHEEEITQFDGETVKKMTIDEIFTFLSTVGNLKILPDFSLEVTRTVSRARMKFRTHC